jgi:hypothetical protein
MKNICLALFTNTVYNSLFGFGEYSYLVGKKESGDYKIYNQLKQNNLK